MDNSQRKERGGRSSSAGQTKQLDGIRRVGCLIILAISGLLVLRGRHGLGGRGKWLVLAGVLPVVVWIALLT